MPINSQCHGAIKNINTQLYNLLVSFRREALFVQVFSLIKSKFAPSKRSLNTCKNNGRKSSTAGNER